MDGGDGGAAHYKGSKFQITVCDRAMRVVIGDQVVFHGVWERGTPDIVTIVRGNPEAPHTST
jgi:hypothetical protein